MKSGNEDPTRPVALMVIGLIVMAISITLIALFAAFVIGSSESLDAKEIRDILVIAAIGLPGAALGIWLFLKGYASRRGSNSR